MFIELYSIKYEFFKIISVIIIRNIYLIIIIILDNYAVHYVLIGSDYKVNCLIDDDIMEMDAFNWNYKKSKHKTSINYRNSLRD